MTNMCGEILKCIRVLNNTILKVVVIFDFWETVDTLCKYVNFLQYINIVAFSTVFYFQPCLMTPISQSTSNSEEKYNVTLKKTRALVERCIGLLKSRFRCPSKDRLLFYEPQKAGVIIYACVVLHNFFLLAKVPFLEIIEESDPLNDRGLAEDMLTPDTYLNEGRRQRARIVHETFSSQ